jgi:large repetitive protein
VLTYTYTAQAGSVPRVQYRTGTPGAQGAQTDTFTSSLLTADTTVTRSYTFTGAETAFRFFAANTSSSLESATNGTTISFSNVSCGSAAPTVTAVTPNSGSTAGGTVVTLTGTNFTGVTGVSFGVTAATSFTFNSATSITATAPAGTAGTVNVRVTTASGTSAIAAANQFTYVTPASTLGVSFTNNGTNYAGLTATYTLTPSTTTAIATSGTINAAITLPAGLTFGSATGTGWSCTGVAACSYAPTINGNSSGSPLTLILNVGGSASGTLSPSVTLSGGGAGNTPSATASTTITAPSISAFSPATVSSAGGTSVTISGAGFSTSGNTLTIGGTSITPNSQTATSVGFVVPAGLTAGNPTVIVTNAGGGSASSNGLTVTAVPVLGLQIVHTGNFTQGQTGSFTITPSVSSGSATSGTLTFSTTLPAGFNFNSVSGTGWSCSGGATVTCTSTTSIASGANGNTITLVVNVSSASATSVTLSGTLSGGGASASTSASDTVTVNQVATTIQVLAGDNQTATTGTAFTTALQVRVLDGGGVAIPFATVTFTAPASGASAVFTGGGNTLAVTANASGNATSGTFSANNTGGAYIVEASSGSPSNNFRLTNGPASQTITFAPLANASLSASPLTLTASASSGLTVAFTSATTSVCTVSGTTLTLLTTGTCTINADQAGNASFSAAPQVSRSFTVTPGAPTVTAVAPNSGSTAGGTVVTLTGTNFTGATGVTFGVTAAASFTVNSATSITATAPAGAAGVVNVRVTTAGGTSATGVANQFTYVTPAPTVTAVAPNSGSTAGGTVVTLTGTDFTGATGVNFGVTAATSFTVNSATSITATAPAGAAGTVNVRVTTAGGTSATGVANQFTYVTPAPTVTAVAPNSGSTAGGTVVTLTGTNFTGATGVTFGVTAAASFTVNSATSITATAPAGAAGTVNVRVTTAGGTSATGVANQFTYVTPAPTVTAVAPNSGSTAGGTVVTLTGTNFTGATAVSFGGTAAASFTVNSATSITATAPAGAAGVLNITVTTPGGTSAAAAANQFTYVTPAPTVTGLTPNSGSTVGGNLVIINGTGFTGVTGVNFGGVPATGVFALTSTVIQAVAPAGAAGTVNVTVTTAAGTSAAAPANQYTYTTPAPTVTAISPTSGSTAGGTVVTLTGTNFTGATAVSFGGSAATSFTVNSATSITATAPAGAAGTVNITVTTPGGTSATAAANQFTYVAPAPTVTAITPNSGSTVGGTAVTLTGTNFTGATAVSFGGAAATSFTVNSATSITATAPAGAAGTVNVAVTTPSGTSAAAAANQFTYVLPAPTVTGIAPNTGSTSGGTVVTLTGTNFIGTTSVSFGATPATSFTVNNATSLTAIAPNGTAGVVNVRVTTGGGTSATAAGNQFTYVTPAPTVTAVTPNTGNTAGGTVVTLTGTDFTGATSVSFGATAAASFVVNSATSITATTPAGAAGTVNVRVTTGAGTSAIAAANQFTYVTPVPNVTAVTPNTGTTAGGTAVTLTGTGFAGATAVRFGTTAATGFTVNSDSSITATAPAGSGSVNITVTTPAGTSLATGVNQFTYVAPAPTVTALAPSSGPINGGTNVVITGTNLTGATGVSFGGRPATFFFVNSPTQISAVSPTAPGPAAFNVQVTTPSGISAPGPQNVFTYLPVPTVTGVSPATGVATGGTVVALTGTGFTGVSAVSFGGVPATSFTVNSATSITATAPPGAVGTVNITVAASGGTSATEAANQFTYVAPTLVLSPTALTAPVYGSAYNQTITAIGGNGSYSFSVTAGALPAGLTLSTSGVLSGTPTAAGTFNFTITATDTSATPLTGARPYSVTIAAPTIAVTPASLVAVVNPSPGNSYTAALSAAGGIGPYSFAVTAGTVPPGLTVSNTGVFAGTPTAGGSFTFTVTATDAGGFTGSRVYTVPVNAPSLALTPTTLPNGTGGTPYSQTIGVIGGGTAPFTFSLTAGALPPGLTLSNSGTLSGTPSAPGSFNFTVTALDSSTGTGPYSVSQAYTVAIGAGSQTISFTSTAPTSATVGGTGYTPIATATSALPVTFTIDAASTGVCSIAGGVVSFVGAGTCTVNANQAGNGAFSAAPQVQQSFAVGRASQTISFTSAAPTGATVGGATYTPMATATSGLAVAFSIDATSTGVCTISSGVVSFTGVGTCRINANQAGNAAFSAAPQVQQSFAVGAPTITLTPTALQPATVATPFSATLSAGGGAAPYSFAVTGGALPAGMALSTGGTLSGTPSAGGTFTFTVTATDAAGFTGARAFTLTVAAPTVTVGPASLPGGRVGQSYAQALAAAGGTAPYRFAVTAGALPAGLTLAADGGLSGRPTAAGSFTFTVTATDTSTGSGPYSGSQAYTVSIAEAAPIAGAVNATAAYGSSANLITLALSGGPATSVSVASPPANGTATANGTSIVYTPSPTFIGTDSFTYTATGPGGTSAPATVTIAVSPPPPPVATNVSVTTAYQTARALDLAGSVTGVSTSVAIATPPTRGTATLAGTTVTYTPAAGFIGTDTFTFTATGPGGTSAPATVTVIVSPPPPPTVANVTTTTPYQTVRSIDLAPSVTGVSSSLAIATPPTRGTATLAGTTVTYTPAAGFIGTDSFTYTATGPGGTSAPATVSVTVAPPPPPVASNVTVSTPFQTARAIDLAPSVTGVSTSIAIGAAPTRGTATVSGTTVTYTPAAGFFGADSFTYTATGPGGTSAPATVTITVATPPPPTATGTSASTPFETPLPIDVARLVTGVSTGIAIATAPANGTATVSGTVITYTPAPNYAGTDSFTYTATGPGGTSAPATITLTVAPLPPPAPAPRQATTDSNRSVTFDVTTGLRGAPFTVAIATPPPSGRASVQGGVISFTPAPDSPANVRFTFTVTSRFGTSQPTPIDVAVNVVPVPVPLKSAQTLAGTSVTVSLSDGATGGPFTAAALVGPLDPAMGSAAITRQGNGLVLTFTAGQTFSGLARISYTLSNSYTTSVPAVVEVTVNARPDPTTDPNVRSIVDTQVQTSQRFATQQIRNIDGRLQQLHDGGGTGFTNQLSLGGNIFTHYALGDRALIDAFTSYNPYARLGFEGGYNALAGGAGRSSALRGDVGSFGGGARQASAIRGTGLGALVAGDASALDRLDSAELLQAAGTKSYGGGDNPFGAWLGGSLEFGTRDAVGGNGAFRFTTGGVTGGLDYRFSDKFILGGSIGYGQDLTDLANGQGRVSSQQYSGSIYASSQPAPRLFIDGLFGYGRTSFDTRRLAQQTGATITGSRDSEQIFASLNITYEYRGGRLWLAPYGRVDFVGATLFDYAERGDAVYALRVLDQSSSLVTGAAGFRLRYSLPFAGGTLTPTFRAEVQYDLEQGGAARLRYADLSNGFIYSFSSQQYARARGLFGGSLSYFMPRGVRLKLDYEGTAMSNGTNHLFRFTTGVAF